MIITVLTFALIFALLATVNTPNGNKQAMYSELLYEPVLATIKIDHQSTFDEASRRPRHAQSNRKSVHR